MANTMMIQAPAPFTDGTFVLHKIEINGHKYSAWFGKDGVVFSAERISSDNQRTFNVPLNKQKNVAEQLTKIGKRYVGRSVPGVQMFALLAEYQRGGTYGITVREGSNVEPLGNLGWIIFTDPAKLLADMESGKVMLNMRFEKRNAIMDHLRTMVTPTVVV